MTDVLTPEQRKYNMSRIRGKNTKPELLVRSYLHGLGYRFRIHYPDLPGKPDIVFTRRKKIIEINGCFWHGHDCKQGFRSPATNTEFWNNKITRNMERDTEKQNSWMLAGYDVLILWECQVKSGQYDTLIEQFLEP